MLMIQNQKGKGTKKDTMEEKEYYKKNDAKKDNNEETREGRG